MFYRVFFRVGVGKTFTTFTGIGYAIALACVFAVNAPNVFEKIFRTQSPNIDRYLAEDGRIDFIFMQKHSSLLAVAARELFTNGDHYGCVSDHTGYCIEFEPN